MTANVLAQLGAMIASAVLHGTGAMTVADVDRDGRDDVLVDVM